MRLPLAALALFGLAMPAAAGGEYEKWFAGKGADSVCYSRKYDAAHMARHPRQKVIAIELDFDANSSRTEGGRPTRFVVGLTVRFKDKSGWYGSVTLCNERATGGLACSLESDGGQFNLQEAGDGLELRPTTEISIEGEDFVTFGGKTSDDNVFILKTSPQSVCDASTAEFR